MGARTPAAGPARLTERDLAAIEERITDLTGTGMLLRAEQRILRGDIPALVAALRAAWAERDEARAECLVLFETTRRYREALERIADGAHNFHPGYSSPKFAIEAAARAALAAPGGQATEPPTDRCVCGAHTRAGCGTWCSDYRRTQALAAPGAGEGGEG